MYHYWKQCFASLECKSHHLTFLHIIEDKHFPNYLLTLFIFSCFHCLYVSKFIIATCHFSCKLEWILFIKHMWTLYHMWKNLFLEYLYCDLNYNPQSFKFYMFYVNILLSLLKDKIVILFFIWTLNSLNEVFEQILLLFIVKPDRNG